MGNTAARKMANMVRNLAEDRIRIVRGIFTPNAA
jgi:hypothetical protein